MPGRSFTGPGYRYGFNGKENDNEVKGIEGSQQDYGMRIYDPRLGRFLSVDPISDDYPELTPYQFASNTPIQAIDVDGLEAWLLFGTSEVWTVGELTKASWDVSIPKTVEVPEIPQEAILYPIDEPAPVAPNPVPPASSLKKGGQFAKRAVDKAKQEKVADKDIQKDAQNKQTTKREPSAKSRQKWEEANKKPWPKDPKDPTKNQDVSHKKPLKDGGNNDADNLEPMPHDKHMEMHKQNGDFKRWALERQAAKRNKSLDSR